jgi:hypothetical protein
MDWRAVFGLNFQLADLIQASLKVIFIAIVFEFLSWWLARRIESWVTPLIPNDAGRDRTWAMRRRTTLKQTPKVIARTTCYTSAMLLVLNVFNVPILPLAIALGAGRAAVWRGPSAAHARRQPRLCAPGRRPVGARRRGGN